MGAKPVKIYPEAGKRIKQLLKEHKKTQEWLAEELNITPVNLSYIVRGKRGLTLERAQIIASLFPGNRVEWIMGMDEHRTNQEKEEETRLKIFEMLADEMIAFDAIAKRLGYFFDYDVTLIEDYNDPSCVSIYKHNELIATCSFSDYVDAMEDIKNFSSFLITKLTRKYVKYT